MLYLFAVRGADLILVSRRRLCRDFHLYRSHGATTHIVPRSTLRLLLTMAMVVKVIRYVALAWTWLCLGSRSSPDS